jgi:hypothetical protein
MMTLALDKNSRQLLSCMEQVVMEWAFTSLDYLGEPGPKPAKLPLERTVMLQGEHCRVCMVVRGSTGLGHELARCVGGAPGAALEGGEAAFTELCSLLAEEWRRRERSENGVDWRLQGLTPSSPTSWPAAKPDAAVVGTVKGLALEALIWVPLGPAA